MGKKIYVNGDVVVKTMYFAPRDVGCGYHEPPEDIDEVIEPQDEVEGCKCFLIDDEHPQSLFNEYYAKGDAASDSILASYLSASYEESIREYGQRIGEICNVVKKVSDWDATNQAVVYKMAYVNILTALDAFLCYVIIKRSLQDEEWFKDLMFELAPKNKRGKWQSLIDEGKYGDWEQDAIRYLQETSLLNVEKVDDAIKCLKFERLEYDRKTMKSYFRIRHLLVHRSGRRRDDTEEKVTYDMLAELINATHKLVIVIFDSICTTLDREMRNRPPERDIAEIFPGGVVHTPFKLSDLARLLRSGEDEKPFEPIELPTL